MALLRVEDVSLSYEKRTVLSGLDFAVEKGDYLCIVGENGSGKSTLIRALLGLKGVSEGRIVWDASVRKGGIGYLPQQNGAQRDFPASVEEIVRSGCLNRRVLMPFYSAADRRAARTHLEEMGIADLKSRSFGQLSGGQQQRVLLARALCATRSVLLLDEPTAGLDPHVTADLYELIAKINASGITIIMVTHDLAAAMRDSSHILHIARHPLFFGRTADYADSPAGRHFLGEHEREDHAHACPFEDGGEEENHAEHA